MTLTRDHLRRIILVARARDAGFVDLVGLAELDPARAFQGATMRGADLRGEDLSGFDFSGASFAGADVRGADFTRTLGLTPGMFRHAVLDDTTKWPPGMRELRPVWADDSGTDEHGRWVSFSVPAADGTRTVQRMRWIPPGRFMIGSPDEEDGRFRDEGPQQEVTIADGFWLFDTACTEALWEAVAGKAPAPRRGAEFPATNVSWADAQDFVQRLNAAKPGLDLSLPSEARWEYACRAGTTTPYSFGTEINRALVCYQSDAPVPAGSLPPNGWGLYEMHGNVWEWCADQWHDSHEGAPNDGSAWPDRKRAADRVFRGGSWAVVARGVRAACRGRSGPARRNSDVGFRCARVQSGSEALHAKRGAGRSKPGEQSETAATTAPQIPDLHKAKQIGIAGTEAKKRAEQLVNKRLLEQKREQIISALDRHLGTIFIRRRGVCFWNANHDKRLICTISKRYGSRYHPYWFGYRLKWHDFLAEQRDGHLALGCMDLPFAFLIPNSAMAAILSKLNTTMIGDRVDYWHLRIVEPTPGSYALAVPNSQPFALDSYRVPMARLDAG
jgi:formylglycine-generating enzyme required for sulfatase activity